MLRDEFVIKIQLDWLNPERTKELLEERVAYLDEQLILTSATLHSIEENLGLVSESERAGNMPYQIYERKYELTMAEKRWCQSLLEHKKTTRS
ncbi:hypothetical protein MFLO_03740 [Listeria floridensis FSL S10-1187]|uniref:Transcription regulator PadR C-terminal domain-containing protein n=1 Tax=Listeria floridensis FSL S10-1187 TaxID=1265817 RepID=A0ABN0RHB4_9LIST|nr:hypothetical protein [Listeria floridensis]EUJ33224.1 hypothetical protein MFLO_03740 [Listeria floridensis FSL S10-1187]